MNRKDAIKIIDDNYYYDNSKTEGLGDARSLLAGIQKAFNDAARDVRSIIRGEASWIFDEHCGYFAHRGDALILQGHLLNGGVTADVRAHSEGGFIVEIDSLPQSNDQCE